MEILKFGKSVKGKDITAYTFSKKKNLPVVLVMATVHGDEIEGWWLLNNFLDILKNDFHYLNINCVSLYFLQNY